jgi:hypothetical protein
VQEDGQGAPPVLFLFEHCANPLADLAFLRKYGLYVLLHIDQALKRPIFNVRSLKRVDEPILRKQRRVAVSAVFEEQLLSADAFFLDGLVIPNGSPMPIGATSNVSA